MIHDAVLRAMCSLVRRHPVYDLQTPTAARETNWIPPEIDELMRPACLAIKSASSREEMNASSLSPSPANCTILEWHCRPTLVPTIHLTTGPLQRRGYLCHLRRADLASLLLGAARAQQVLDRSEAAVDMRIALRLSAFRMSRPRLRRSTRVPE